MPDTPHPPFVAAAKTTPRQLQKWLDINPQGGPLGRTQSYLTISPFTELGHQIDPLIQGVISDIAAVFNCEAPNNFSLKQIPTIDPSEFVNGPYMLCVMYIAPDGVTVVRYKLYKFGDVTYTTDWPQYTGQVILKNFRFEIWSPADTVNVISVVQNSPIVFFTSVLGNQDYRWGDDFTLANLDPIVVQLLSPVVGVPFPILGWRFPITFPADSVPQPN